MFKSKRKLQKELDELKAKVAKEAEDISKEMGIKYVPAHETVQGIYLPESEKIKIDRQYREDIKQVQEN